MITDIKRNEEDYFRIRFIYDSTLSFCEALGWFDRLIYNDIFFNSLPRIKIDVDDNKEVITIDYFKNLWVEKEVTGIMDRCGFKLQENKYIESTGRTLSIWKIEWKKKQAKSK